MDTEKKGGKTPRKNRNENAQMDTWYYSKRYAEKREHSKKDRSGLHNGQNTGSQTEMVRTCGAIRRYQHQKSDEVGSTWTSYPRKAEEEMDGHDSRGPEISQPKTRGHREKRHVEAEDPSG